MPEHLGQSETWRCTNCGRENGPHVQDNCIYCGEEAPPKPPVGAEDEYTAEDGERSLWGQSAC